MFITVQFKNKDKVFCGRTYDFQLNEMPPKIGSVIRMYKQDFSATVCNGTRVLVVDVKEKSESASQIISYIETTLDD